MQSPFGPFYVAPLQHAVDHAERLAHALELLERDPQRALLHDTFFHDFEGPEARALWVVGRAQEIVTVVADVIGEWRAARLSAEAAAEALEAYLAALHAGMLAAFEVAEPACCAPPQPTPVDDEITRPLVVTRDATTLIPVSLPLTPKLL